MHETDWARLFHAYGAATDTPRHLAALRAGRESEVAAALEHLNGAIVHQGTPWPATPPAVRQVAELLAGEHPAGARSALLGFLRYAAEAAPGPAEAEECRARAFPADGAAIDAWEEAWANADEEEQEALWDGEMADLAVLRAAVGVFDALPAVHAAAAVHLTDPDARVRAAAAACVAITAAHPALAGGRQEVVRVLTTASRTAGTDERAALAVHLGELGEAPRPLLADPEPAVRVCAALAPALEGDEDADAVLLESLRDPAALDAAFGRTPATFPGRPRFTVSAAVCRRVTDPERLLPAALAVLPLLQWRYPNPDLGPYLPLLFPDGWPAAHAATPPQRAYAAALAAHDTLWDPRGGNRGALFAPLGLPDDRSAWRALSATSESRRTS
ncbi:hypothetical protein OH779_13780 [Actinacidiphila glaucinigra]|uniref:hypothetical protein n=1 Tax=Actinacidiphila glaucinigra TaxID=235986 RepID=UPI0038636099